MRWRILAALDMLFSTAWTVMAGVLGNVLVSGYVPDLHSKANAVSRYVVRAFTAPDTIADWLLATSVIRDLALGLAVAGLTVLVLTLFSKVIPRAIAVAYADKYGTDLGEAYRRVQAHRGTVWRLKYRAMLRAAGRLLVTGSASAIGGSIAGGAAWLLVLLINHTQGGFFHIFFAVASIVCIFFISEFLKEIVVVVNEAVGGDLEQNMDTAAILSRPSR